MNAKIDELLKSGVLFDDQNKLCLRGHVRDFIDIIGDVDAVGGRQGVREYAVTVIKEEMPEDHSFTGC